MIFDQACFGLGVQGGLLLGERAGPRRLIAVGVGLLGALIVIRPGYSIYGWATLLPLLSALTYALNMILLKKASRTRSTLTMQCGTTIYAAMILVGIAVILKIAGLDGFVVLETDLKSWGLIVCAGAEVQAWRSL